MHIISEKEQTDLGNAQELEESRNNIADNPQTCHVFHEWFFKLSSATRLNLLAILIGIIGGFGAWIFRELTDLVYTLVIRYPQQLIMNSIHPNLAWLPFLISPIICGIIVGFLVSRVSKEAKGHGIPEIIKSIILKNGAMDLKVPFIKIIASAFTIGSGGSAGREGPIAQIGAGFGSLIGQKLDLTPEELRTIVIAGVAAGVSSIFNAPIGGVFFAIEVVKRESGLKDLSTLLIASVMGTITGHLLFGNNFTLSISLLTKFTEIQYVPLYILLGVIAGCGAVLWIRFFYFMEDRQSDFFKKIKLPGYAQPAIGAIGVGMILVLTYQFAGESWEEFTVMGIDYVPMNLLLNSITPAGSIGVVFAILLLIFFVKAIATGFTIGSGGSGGVFAPTLFLGVFLGSGFGVLMVHFFRFPDHMIGVFALVGMAAFFTGTVRAPFTAVIMSAEMTGDYYITIPLMFAVTFSWLISDKLQPEDIYMKKLQRQNITYTRRLVNVLDEMRVREVMSLRTQIISLFPSDRVEKIIELSENTEYHGFPVIENDRLLGVVTLRDTLRFLEENEKDHTIHTLLTHKQNTRLFCVRPETTVMQAASIMIYNNINQLPVVNLDNHGYPKMVGWFRMADFSLAYSRKYPLVDPREIKNNMLVFDLEHMNPK